MQSKIAEIVPALIQIATPYSTGTGFYVAAYDLIITNYHVVTNNRFVVIEGDSFEKQLSKVLFTDPKHDLAFLEAPSEHSLPTIELADETKVNEGMPVWALGHPFGLKISVTSGIISQTRNKTNGVIYYQHDAAINPGNSGGPLVNDQGQILGINTFNVKDSTGIGFSLPVNYLRKGLTEFLAQNSVNVTRCVSCVNVVNELQLAGQKHCPNCGTKITLPNEEDEYIPTGISYTIEQIIKESGHEVATSRSGPFAWEIKQGSARIQLQYHENTGLIIADAILCQLPKQEIQRIYEFLLRENNKIENMGFSVHNNDIVLSLVIYDRYLNPETGAKMLSRILELSDYYDDVLVNEFGADWKH